jgi:hypothetical protein
MAPAMTCKKGHRSSVIPANDNAVRGLTPGSFGKILLFNLKAVDLIEARSADDGYLYILSHCEGKVFLSGREGEKKIELLIFVCRQAHCAKVSRNPALR